MKIESLRIKNLRTFSDVTIPFNGYVCLVGPNGVGKSTVLCALNIFFRETTNASTDLTRLTVEDFHQKNAKTPIEVTVTFADLNADAQKDFADYFRQGKLVVSAAATFNESTGFAEVKQQGQRLGLAEFKDFFRAAGDSAKVADLKALYAQVRKDFTDLPGPGTKDAMIDSLRQYEASHPDQCILIPSDDQFYGVSKGAGLLEKYVQWVYVPAVKDATTEQIEGKNTALGKLLARTVRSKVNFAERIQGLRGEMQTQYQALLDESQDALDGISAALKSRLAEWAHPDATLNLRWSQDLDKSVRVEEPLARIFAGEGDFEGELARFGHGLQRSYLLALLQELATSNDADAPRLILGCEEPELYQHPPQARHLATVLQKLSQGNAQVIVSTHHPAFVSGEAFEDVRMVRRDHAVKASTVAYMSYLGIADAIAAATGEKPKKAEGILAKIHQALQPSLNEMFFTPRLVFVEGLEDLAYICAHMQLSDRWETYRRLGCHIVPAGKKSEMLQPLVIAKHMKIPTYVVFDADSDAKENYRDLHKRDNKALLALFGATNEDPMPTTTVWGSGFVMWHSCIGSIVRDEIGEADWTKAQAAAEKQYGHAGGLGKNTLLIAAILTSLWTTGKKSASLDRVCVEILDVAKSV